MAADGSVDWRIFFRLRDPSASGALLGFLALGLRRQNSLPSAGCRTALALCPRPAASALFRRFGRYGRRNLAQAQRTCWFKPTGQGVRVRYRFWLSSVNTIVACPVM
jgi:hypothetical protein